MPSVLRAHTFMNSVSQDFGMAYYLKVISRGAVFQSLYYCIG
uniref:Uncharacterized protein n=1 Tax=Anguilla anguilla TaxID=7936 RepID=A0A0E9PHX8_ANGAN